MDTYIQYNTYTTAYIIHYNTIQGVHRVLVMPKVSFTSPTQTFLSQTDVVKYFYKNQAKFHGELEGVCKKKLLSVLDFENGSDKIVTVLDSVSALQGFRTLGVQNVSAAAIVNTAGELTGCISFSDLKGLHRNTIPDLLLPASEYLADRKLKALKEKSGVSCLLTDSLESVMEKVVTYGIHRVFIVDADNKPIGVVSLSDIIRILFLSYTAGFGKK